MKTPEQIKAGMRHCVSSDFCNSCPIENVCNADVMEDALTLIEQLEEQIMCMKIQMHGDCGVCKHRSGFKINYWAVSMSKKCEECIMQESRPNWEYEGLPEVKSR